MLVQSASSCCISVTLRLTTWLRLDCESLCKPLSLCADSFYLGVAADSFHNAGPHGEGNHVLHAHHDVPYSVSYTETMQQPLSPMVVGPSMDQHHKDSNQMAHHLNLHGENIVHG